MNKEKSCGAIIYRTEGSVHLFLLLKYPHAETYWGLAKGHVEKDETEQETATREIQEETGIHSPVFIPNFREVITYSPAPDVEKTVVFFLAKTDQLSITLSDEHNSYLWLLADDALTMLTYQSDRDILSKAVHFLKTNR